MENINDLGLDLDLQRLNRDSICTNLENALTVQLIEGFTSVEIKQLIETLPQHLLEQFYEETCKQLKINIKKKHNHNVSKGLFNGYFDNTKENQCQ